MDRKQQKINSFVHDLNSVIASLKLIDSLIINSNNEVAVKLIQEQLSNKISFLEKVFFDSFQIKIKFIRDPNQSLNSNKINFWEEFISNNSNSSKNTIFNILL